MDISLRIITRLPLEELWRDDGFATTARLRQLVASDIRDMLRVGQVQFVVADVAAKPWWVDSRNCFSFWKNEVKPHLAEDPKIILEAFPDEYCYFASQWGHKDGEPPIVVLEKHH